jgi:hypothetical protein
MLIIDSVSQSQSLSNVDLTVHQIVDAIDKAEESIFDVGTKSLLKGFLMAAGKAAYEKAEEIASLDWPCELASLVPKLLKLLKDIYNFV